MSIKSRAYGAASVGLGVGSVVPGIIGTGFVAVGNKFLGASRFMAEKANEYGLFAAGLELLESGELSADYVKEFAEQNGLDFKSAVIGIMVNAQERGQDESLSSTEAVEAAEEVSGVDLSATEQERGPVAEEKEDFGDQLIQTTSVDKKADKKSAAAEETIDADVAVNLAASLC